MKEDINLAGLHQASIKLTCTANKIGYRLNWNEQERIYDWKCLLSIVETDWDLKKLECNED